MEITIYGQPNCSGCTAAKTLLDVKGWKYTYHSLPSMEPNAARLVVDESHMRSVPIVKIDNTYIGGLNALEGYIRGVEERKV